MNPLNYFKSKQVYVIIENIKDIIVLFSGVFIVPSLVFGVIWFAVYTTEKQAGYYCDYCHQGSYRNKTEVLYTYGNKPCPVAQDSIHHFSWWMVAPQFKKAPKYVKE